VKNKLHLVFIVAKPLMKIGSVNPCNDLLVAQINPGPFMRRVSRQSFEIVDSDNVVKSILIQPPNKAAPNKA
jgi:hypothetical protein